MLLARVFALTLGICLTIAMQAQQTSKSGEVTHVPQQTGPGSLPDAAKSQNPFIGFTEFSATMVGSLLGNIDETKVYRSGKLMRTEMPNGQYFVTDLTTLDTILVLPKRCMHDTVAPIYAFPFTTFRSHPIFQVTPAGEEIVDGHHCHVKSALRTSGGGSAMKMRLWAADDLNGFPVKIEVEAPGGRIITIAYKDVKIGPPDPAVFKHPAKCDQEAKPRQDKH
jgi:hypothetical protein